MVKHPVRYLAIDADYEKLRAVRGDVVLNSVPGGLVKPRTGRKHDEPWRSTTQRGLLALQARSLRVVLGVPRASPSAGVLSEAHKQRIEALHVQETLRHYSRFSTQHEAHHLADLHTSRPASSFAEVVRNHVEAFPANAAPRRHPQRALGHG
ncbi:hypothetical protein HPB47_027112 [Ixodes persulcatus]|uniref:Uncharacterized protein n=1 Tax=Ixodes persulcatus TaxID=34615 RepID=A0AC60PYG1_IXOPE|nr:hypothetical protein HPB47_027112 [Ixodes persulcatus]